MANRAFLFYHKDGDLSEIGGQNAPKTAAEDKSISIPDYVTRAEYEAITAQIDDIRKQIKELIENESAEQ